MNFHEHYPLSVDAQRKEAIRRALEYVVWNSDVRKLGIDPSEIQSVDAE